MKKHIILPFLVLMLVFQTAYSQSYVIPAPKVNTGYSQSTTHYTISTPQGVQHGTVQMQTQDLQQVQRINEFNRQQNQYYQQQLNQTNQPVIVIQPDVRNNNSHSSQPNTMYNQSKQINSYPTTNEEVRRILLKKAGGN